MAVGCGAKCAKAMLIIFNIIFWLSGCALLGVGIWLRIDHGILKVMQLSQINQEDKVLDYAAYLIIAIGAFVFLVGFLGCCGAIKENKCCLGLYIFFLLIVMAAELAAGVLVLVYKDGIVGAIEGGLTKEIGEDNYVSKDDKGKYVYTTFGTGMNFAQTSLMCCGVNGPADYTGSNYTKSATDTGLEFVDFPFTCCKMKKDTDTSKEATVDNIEDKKMCIAKTKDYYYTQGCKDGLEDFVNTQALILVGIGIGIACLEIFGFIFAVCLCRNTSADDE